MLSSEHGYSDSTITFSRIHHRSMDLSMGSIRIEGPGKRRRYQEPFYAATGVAVSSFLRHAFSTS
jgi:hypothetical protein